MSGAFQNPEIGQEDHLQYLHLLHMGMKRMSITGLSSYVDLPMVQSQWLWKSTDAYHRESNVEMLQ